jgi:hypothetical protein
MKRKLQSDGTGMLDIRINNKISELEENMYNRNKSHNIQKSRLPPRWLYCPPVGKVLLIEFDILIFSLI